MENVLIDDNFNAIIVDLGFTSLKKLQCLKQNYNNLGYFTAPEYLDKSKNKFNYI